MHERGHVPSSNAMRDTFGGRARQRREQRGVSLADVAAQTKIKQSLLDGLERDDISQWPAGIFTRAYVRAYACAIGLDPDVTVREFLEAHPEPVKPIEPPQPAPTRLRSLIGSAFGTFRRTAEVGSEVGGRAPEVGSRVPEVGGRTAEVGDRRAEVGGRRPEVGDRAPEVGGREGRGDGGVGNVPAAEPTPEPVTPKQQPAAQPQPVERIADLLAAAKVCTDLGRIEASAEIQPLLREAAKILGARGVIVWVWDPSADELRPALVHGYSPKVRARLCGVGAAADNVMAASFRSSAVLAVGGTEGASGALAVPLLGPNGCAGVFALELPDGGEQDPVVRAIAMFVAAMLAQLVGVAAGDSTADVDVRPPLEEARPG